MTQTTFGVRIFAGVLAALLLAGCGNSNNEADQSAMDHEDMSSPPVDFTGVWSTESLYVNEGVATGVPITLHNTGWAPLSDGPPEQRQAQSFEEQKAWYENIISNDLDVFVESARRRFNPPFSEAGMAAIGDMQANRTPPGSPYERCLPSNITGFGGTTRMVQQDDLIVAISENGTVRHVYLDGRSSDNALPSYEGHSLGRFNSDGSLVVETTAFMGTTFGGWPMSNEARLIETISLSEDGNQLIIKTQYEDPVNLTEPVARMTYLFRQPDDYEMIFGSCIENVYGSQEFDQYIPDYINQ